MNPNQRISGRKRKFNEPLQKPPRLCKKRRCSVSRVISTTTVVKLPINRSIVDVRDNQLIDIINEIYGDPEIKIPLIIANIISDYEMMMHHNDVLNEFKATEFKTKLTNGNALERQIVLQNNKQKTYEICLGCGQITGTGCNDCS